MTGIYRPEIDGLRAVAVICVVLYHLGVPGVSAGFIGVDVFFVISGYLITGQLWASRTKPLSALLFDFYARRARRILPSLVLVIVATLATGKLLLLPTGEQQDLAKSAIAAALFVSNLFFWKQAGDYFAGPAELQPLLHTWSLSVEEQFYLVWPLLLALLWTMARHLPRWRDASVVCAGILGVSAISLVFSIAWTGSSPGAAFFTMPARLWELGAGAGLALASGGPGRARLPRFAGAAGLAAILAGVFIFSRATPFPGAAALLPVAGTALLIAACAQHKSGRTFNFLASRPMTLTGEISYSWYLWHWPLLAIGRALDMGAHDLARDSALVLLAYVLAYGSTRYMETPIRQKRVALFSQTGSSLLTGFCLLSLAAGLSVALWLPARAYYRSDLAPASLSCMGEIELDPGGPCALSKGKRAAVFLAGDSHANHWAPAIATWAGTVDVGAVERSLAGCPVLLADQAGRNANKAGRYPEACRGLSKRVMAEIRQSAASSGPTGVILSAHWQADLALDESLGERLAQALDELGRAGARVLIIGTTPRFRYAIPACVKRRDPDECRISRGQHDTETKAANEMLAAIVARHPHARVWNPAAFYCDAAHCFPQRDGLLMFRDADHLSRRGAHAAAPDLNPELEWLLQPRHGRPRR